MLNIPMPLMPKVPCRPGVPPPRVPESLQWPMSLLLEKFTKYRAELVKEVADVVGEGRVKSVNGRAGDVTLAASDVGLGNVANTGDSAVPAEGGTAKFTTGGAYAELAKKVSIADLFDNPTTAPTVKSSLLPSYVDDVLEYASLADFPDTGETGKIYVALDTNKTYRWGGSAYAEISASLALGETSSTAYQGDRGKTAYDHATDPNRLTTAQASGLYKIETTAEGHVKSVTAVQKSDITDLGIPEQDTVTAVVAPSTDPADAGKAADAKATGDALAAKLSRAEAEAGYTRWTVKRDGVDVTAQVQQPTFFEGEGWATVVQFPDLNNNPFVAGTAESVSLTWDAYDTEAGFSSVAYTATRTRITPTKTSQLTNDGSDGQHPFLTEHQSLANYATKSDATLTDAYSEWTYNGLPEGAAVSSAFKPTLIDGIWMFGFDYGGSEYYAEVSGGTGTETSLLFDCQKISGDSGPSSITVTATRSIIGYTLGSQSTKPLQPQGDYAPATNIAKSALASDVQTSLGKADTAVQPSALRYDLPANATTIASASQEVVEGVTVNYGAATLADRTSNRVAITAALDELRLTFPAAVSGKVRDFGLRVEVGTGSAALTAPALVPVEPTGETIKLENADGAIPALADGAADAKGVTLLYFSETSPGVFLVKGEQVKEVA